MKVNRSSGILNGRWLAVTVAIATMGISLFGCSGETQDAKGPGDETPVGTDRVASEPAIKALAETRCKYEERCGNVGQDRTYSDADHCQKRFTADYGKELNAWECPGGIDRAELDECLTEIGNNDCNSPFDSLERAIACRSGELCKAAR